jgi:hypothetical protein
LPLLALALLLGLSLFAVIQVGFCACLNVAISVIVIAYAGYIAGVDASPDVRAPLKFLLGLACGGAVVFFAGVASLLERSHVAIVVGRRVVSSWFAAAALILLALAFRGQAAGRP